MVPAVGITSVDHRLNCQLYGDDVAPRDILHGRVAVPAEFLPLYDAIDGLAAEAQARRCVEWHVGLASGGVLGKGVPGHLAQAAAGTALRLGLLLLAALPRQQAAGSCWSMLPIRCRWLQGCPRTPLALQPDCLPACRLCVLAAGCTAHSPEV